MDNSNQAIVKLITGFIAGERHSLARLITLLENEVITLSTIRDRLPLRQSKTLCLGITGAGGVGKSSLVNRLISEFRQQGLTTAVVAVDPSSNFTGGALLGDRIRMYSHNEDDGVFIRSLASRGSLGGLSSTTNEIVDLVKAFGFDVILIETTGVGQAEVNIFNIADLTLLVMAPGYGDEIQLMKAGQIEAADIIVINKADRDGAEDLFNGLEGLFMMKPDMAQPPIIMTQATNNEGIKNLYAAIEQQRNHPGKRKPQMKN